MRSINEATSAAKSRSPSALRDQTSVFSRDFVVEALRDGGSVRDLSSNKLGTQRASELTAEETQVAAIKGALQFVGFMLSPRHHNLRTYIQRNAQHSPRLPLSGCFAAMVDFNYWLDCPAKASQMEDQVRIHEQLSLLSRGFLLPLVAYNPWVDIQDKDVSITLVEKAIQYHGCVGAKIYPPMGFYPFNNTGLPLATQEKRPDLEALDKKLVAFYELCDSLGVPVMAHANESNGRDDEHDKLAGVAGWKALRDNEGKVKANIKSLYVNAGHFGGAHAHQDGDWSDQFVELMKPKGRLNVFADLGYWNEIFADSQVVGKLTRELATPLPSGGTVADRVMYGSDWHMLSKEPGWESYAGDMANVIRGLDPSGVVAANVLGGNVLQCYGLTKDSSRGSLERLQKFFADNDSNAGPGWFA
jgi:predicted TIM-barrel fold metal-dependent hydrolase